MGARLSVAQLLAQRTREWQAAAPGTEGRLPLRRRGGEAGRLAYESGRMPRRLYAQASSPEEGLIGSQ